MSKSQVDVFVVSVDSPRKFFVRFNGLDGLDSLDKQADQNLQQMLNDRSEVMTNPAKISPNHLYLTKNSKDQQWYRVQVEEILQNERVKVFFIDSGKTKILKSSELRSCRGPLLKMAGTVIECSLFISDGMKKHLDSQDVNFHFKCLVSKRQPFEVVVHDIVKKVLFVDLITRDRVNNYSVTDVLLSAKGISKAPSQAPRDSATVKTIDNVEIKGKTSVKVNQVFSPSDFYVVLIQLEQDEVVLRTELTEFHHQNPAFFPHLVIGAMCAVQDVFGIWYRAEVLAVPDDQGLTKVRLIDTGKIVIVSWSELFELDKQFYDFPKYAVHCSLAGVEPIDGDWSREALDFFKRCLTRNEQQVEIYPSEDGVELIVLYDGIKININQLLIHKSFAKSTNKELRDFINDDENDKPSDKLHPIEIVSSPFDPLNFHVKFLEYSNAIDKMSEYIEKKLIEEDCNWTVGDICVVPHLVDAEKGKKCHRGRILEIKKGTTEGIKAVVYLIDHGRSIEAWVHKLRKCPIGFMDIGDTVNKVRLACFNRKWNESELKEIQSLIKLYNNFYITFKDNNNILFATSSEPRNVILWGDLNNGVKHNIISELEANGLVKSVYLEKSVLPKDRKDWIPQDFIREAALLEAQEVMPKANPLDGRTINVEKYVVTMKKQIILDWLPAVPSMKMNLIGMPTNVDRAGNIVLHDVCNNNLFETMQKIINDNFKRPSSKNHQFKVGDPVLVNFEQDGLYYRGKILTMKGEDCEVEFIDFGNIQEGKTRYLLHHVICSEIPPLAQRYRLEGTPKDSNGEIDNELLNMLHFFIVDKNITVRVVPEDQNIKDPNYVKRCNFSLRGQEIRNYSEIKNVLQHSESNR